MSRIYVRVLRYNPSPFWYTTFLSSGNDTDPISKVIRGFCNDSNYDEKSYHKIKSTHPEYLDGECYQINAGSKGKIYVKIEFYQQVTLAELESIIESD